MNKIPTYKIFKEEILNKLSDQEKNTLFYWGAFDPSSWEAGLVKNMLHSLPSPSRGQNRVLSMIRKKSKHFKEVISNDSKFCGRFVWGEFLMNYLVTAEVEKIMERSKLSGRISKGLLRKPIFPDLIFKNKEFILPIEIKNIISCSSIKDRIYDEVIGGIKKYKKEIAFDNFLVILLFPFLKKESSIYRRINSIIKGYYVYEDIIGYKTKVKCNVLCHCIAERYHKKYSIEKLAERISKRIKSANVEFVKK